MHGDAETRDEAGGVNGSTSEAKSRLTFFCLTDWVLSYYRKLSSSALSTHVLQMLRFVFLACLLAVPASANTDCIVALCSDKEAEDHQATCAVRCNCHWDKNGIPGSEQYPRCYAETETVQVSIAARQEATVYYAAFTEVEGDSNRINTALEGTKLGQVSLRRAPKYAKYGY